MKARTVVLLIVCCCCLLLFAVLANAQQYYRPHYLQTTLNPLLTSPVFLENRTGGHLKVKIEVNRLMYLVEVEVGSEVRDLMLPVGSRPKVKEATVVVLENGKFKTKTAKYYAYWRGESYTGLPRQGWYFYLSNYFKP